MVSYPCFSSPTLNVEGGEMKVFEYVYPNTYIEKGNKIAYLQGISVMAIFIVIQLIGQGLQLERATQYHQQITNILTWLPLISVFYYLSLGYFILKRRRSAAIILLIIYCINFIPLATALMAHDITLPNTLFTALFCLPILFLWNLVRSLSVKSFHIIDTEVSTMKPSLFKYNYKEVAYLIVVTSIPIVMIYAMYLQYEVEIKYKKDFSIHMTPAK